MWYHERVIQGAIHKDGILFLGSCGYEGTEKEFEATLKRIATLLQRKVAALNVKGTLDLDKGVIPAPQGYFTSGVNKGKWNIRTPITRPPEVKIIPPDPLPPKK